jgi:putative nucleotidyltransferase with HDIG domain
MLSIEDIVRRTPDLPSAPHIALAALRHASDPNASANSLAEIICQDQALVVRVLRLANSAFYATRREVVSITDAVVLLGTRTVRQLCLLASTFPWMMKALPGYDLGPMEMWIHSLSVGVGAQLLAERTNLFDPETAFTAGILHDLGKVALSVWLDNKVYAMARLAEIEEVSFEKIERKVLGFDHQDVGAYMAEAWNVPKPLVQAIRAHHRPLDNKEYPEVVNCVHVADHLSRAMGLGIGGDSMCYEFYEETLFCLRLTYSQLDSLANEMLERYEKKSRLFMPMAA